MKTLIWLGLGAAAMYLLDPDHGRRRRALLRDQVRDRMTRTRHAMREQGTPREIQTPESAHHLGR